MNLVATLAARFLARRKSNRAMIRRRAAQIRAELGLAPHPALKGTAR